jgi:glutathione S-transferase
MVRLALYHGKIDFEDERISYDEVAERRAKGLLPHGQVPVLEIDGVRHSQSMALLRWAGQRAGLYPALLQLQIDAVHESLADVNKCLNPQWYVSLRADNG